MRRYSKTLVGGLCLGIAAGPAWAQKAAPGAPTTNLKPLSVEGLITQSSTVAPPLAPNTVGTASALNDVPGGALIDNGGVSGQVQFRGLTGYRNRTTIDGMGIVTGGPNWMDPPLHYAPAGLVRSLSVTRGIPSVADSVDSIGTRVNATTRTSRYAKKAGYQTHGFVDSTIQSVNNGHSVAGGAWVANQSNRLGATAATAGASATRTPYGLIRASSYQRRQLGLNFGHKGAYGDTSGFVRYQHTG